MDAKIKVAILEDHQSVIDGYLYRLEKAENIQLVGIAGYGEELDRLLDQTPVDVLIMDLNVPTAPNITQPFPSLAAVRHILREHPGVRILIISFLEQQTLIQALVEAGVNGYIVKTDGESIRRLDAIVALIASNGVYFSRSIYDHLNFQKRTQTASIITSRQLEALSLCAAYPDASTEELAEKMQVAKSTMRNLLSGAYERLNVSSRAAAVARLQQLGLIIPSGIETNLEEGESVKEEG